MLVTAQRAISEMPGSPWRRARAYLTRPDIRHDPLRLILRRPWYELERWFAPARLRRERCVRFGRGVSQRPLRAFLRPSGVDDRAIYLYGIREYVTAKAFVELITPGSVVVDVGAHLGQYALLASASLGTSGHVLAFEPNPALRERLARNLRVNRCSNVGIRPEALSDRAGTASLYLPAGDVNTGEASLREGGSREQLDVGGVIDVECLRLDDVVADEGLVRVDLIKVDVEGLEAAVLRGAEDTLRRFRPTVIFEVNDLTRVDGEYHAPAIDLLREYGYAIFGLGSADGRVQHSRLEPTDDPMPYREAWAALNLLAMPERSAR